MQPGTDNQVRQPDVQALIGQVAVGILQLVRPRALQNRRQQLVHLGQIARLVGCNGFAQRSGTRCRTTGSRRARHRRPGDSLW